MILLAGSLYRVDMDCWKMDTKSTGFTSSIFLLVLFNLLFCPVFVDIATLHSGIKIRALPLPGGNLFMVHLLGKIMETLSTIQKNVLK